VDGIRWQRRVAHCDSRNALARGHLLIMWSIELVCGTERKVKENERLLPLWSHTHRDTQHTQRLIKAIRERPLMVLCGCFNLTLYVSSRNQSALTARFTHVAHFSSRKNSHSRSLDGEKEQVARPTGVLRLPKQEEN